MMMDIDDRLCRRFNAIGVDESDLPRAGWQKFFEEGAVLFIQWKDLPNSTEKTIALLKEMPKIK